MPDDPGTRYIPAVAELPYHRLAVVGAGGSRRDEVAYANAARRLGLAARVFDVLHWTQRLKGAAAPLIERAIERFEPDFILCTREAQLLGGARLDRIFRGRASAMWHVDPQPQDGVIDLAQRCGTLYLTYAAQLDRYRRAGVSVVRFLPQAMAPERDIPATRTRAAYLCDASFVGSGPYPFRWPVLAAVAAVCRLQIRGPGWRGVTTDLPIAGGRVHGRAFAQVIAGAAISLGANALPAQADDYASASDRMWKIFGCEGAYVGPHVPGIEQFAQHGQHCFWYHSTDECVAQVQALLTHPEDRAAMAARARAHALAYHTYDHRLRMLLTGTGYPVILP